MLAKLFVIPLCFLFIATEIYAAASSAVICRRQGGSWNQWSQKCTYKKSYKKNYKSYKYKKKNYSKYGSKSNYSRSKYKYNKYKKKNYNSYGSKNKYKYKKKTYSNYGSSNKSKYNSRSTASIKKKALTYCWQNKKKNRWTCDGPTQKLLTFWKSKSKARELAGCSTYSRSRNYSKGILYTCKRSLKSYDRDIRGKYGISRNY